MRPMELSISSSLTLGGHSLPVEVDHALGHVESRVGKRFPFSGRPTTTYSGPYRATKRVAAHTYLILNFYADVSPASCLHRGVPGFCITYLRLSRCFSPVLEMCQRGRGRHEFVLLCTCLPDTDIQSMQGGWMRGGLSPESSARQNSDKFYAMIMR